MTCPGCGRPARRLDADFPLMCRIRTPPIPLPGSTRGRLCVRRTRLPLVRRTTTRATGGKLPAFMSKIRTPVLAGETVKLTTLPLFFANRSMTMARGDVLIKSRHHRLCERPCRLRTRRDQPGSPYCEHSHFSMWPPCMSSWCGAVTPLGLEVHHPVFSVRLFKKAPSRHRKRWVAFLYPATVRAHVQLDLKKALFPYVGDLAARSLGLDAGEVSEAVLEQRAPRFDRLRPRHRAAARQDGRPRRCARPVPATQSADRFQRRRRTAGRPAVHPALAARCRCRPSEGAR